MSLLDDLKKEVDARGAQERMEEERVRSIHDIYQNDIRPRMHDAYHYFMEFFDYLEQIERESGVQMELPGYDKDISLQASPHFVRTDKSNEIGQLECGRRVSGKDLHMEIVGVRKFASQCRYLDLVGLDYKKSDWRGDDGRVIGGRMVVTLNFFQTLRFKVDPATATIDVYMSNFRRFGSHRKRLNPDELGKELFDSIGLFILGRSDTLFIAEQTVQVSAETREKLQKKIAEDKLAKEKELQEGRAERERVKKLEEEQGGGIWGLAKKIKKDS